MVHFYCRLCIFFVGLLLGILLTKLYTQVDKSSSKAYYKIWFKKQGFLKRSMSWDILRYKNNRNIKGTLESDLLFKKVKILCIILLKQNKYEKHIQSTWAKGCNAIKFVNVQRTKSIPLKRDNKNSSWAKLCQTLQDVESYNWILIANEYTFVIMENLRYLLAPLNPEYKYYIGHTVEFWKLPYNTVDSGIVLSEGSLKSLRQNINRNDCLSFSFSNREDYYLGKSLAQLNITPIDIRDENGFTLFFPSNLNSLIFYEDSQYKSSIFPIKCCSKLIISFQAVDGDKMYTYYYLLYVVQLFMEGNLGNKLNSQNNDDQVWKNFLKSRNITNYNISSAEYYQVWENLIDDPTSFAANMKRDVEEYNL
uniref:Glycoprotein-N-acetylgalactosamine 3-beta-galactosyltransferase 1-like n=1 Tax=Diabrotica virgifera virgifera TaxID=50390 RepID=A0A6P7G7E1_DIAVI